MCEVLLYLSSVPEKRPAVPVETRNLFCIYLAPKADSPDISIDSVIPARVVNKNGGF